MSAGKNDALNPRGRLLFQPEIGEPSAEINCRRISKGSKNNPKTHCPCAFSYPGKAVINPNSLHQRQLTVLSV